MSGLETAAIVLGTAVAKTACGIWLGEQRLANEIGNSFIDHAVARVTGPRSQRQLQRIWDQIADRVADRVQPLVEAEYRALPEHERIAAIDAVSDTVDAAKLTERDLFRLDLNAIYLDRHLRAGDPRRPERAGLSANATALYDRLLRECCLFAIEVVHALPAASAAGFEELLRRERQILDTLAELLSRLASQPGVAEFEGAYRQAIRNRLDRVEFFGASLTEASRHYPLSVAYLSLAVSGDFPRPPADPMLEPISRMIDTMRDRPTSESVGTTRVEDVLASSRRLFVRGQAGIGKTTLLQWIAVRSADNSFGERIADWNGTVPFFIPLRRYAQHDLPAPEGFLGEVGHNIADGMQPWWVQRLLQTGKAIVLVDGADELPEERRDDVRRWLGNLIADFPDARYVVTTRPAATPADWLGADDFTVAELEPMTQADVPVFVRRWHAAMRDQCGDDAERDRLTEYEARLLDSIATQRHLRRLAGYPLLCALLCALHRDRRAELPANRMELYKIALEMLLDRRDRGRKLDTSPSLDLTQKTLLLRDIAYWLVRNGWSSANADRVRERLAAKLNGMTVGADAPQIYQALLERSGLLREPVEEQVDFVHRSFQEYLAAAEAADTDDIGALVAHAHEDAWHDVVVLAAGHAPVARRVELLTGILDRADREPGPTADTLRLVALACLDTSPYLPPDQRRRVEQEASQVMPPATMAAAQAVAKAGDFALDLLLKARPPRNAASAAATIRAAAEIGDPAALPLLAQFGTDRRKSVVRELLRAWPRFDPEEYARTVLPAHPLDSADWVEVTDSRLVPGLRHLGSLQRLYLDPADVPVTDLGCVRSLPHLTHLDVKRVADLTPLAGTGLQEFQSEDPTAGAGPLSLTPLRDVPELTYVGVFSQQVTSLPALTALPKLDHLSLTLNSVERIPELAGLTRLGTLLLGDLPEIMDLRPLHWLESPHGLWLSTCPALADLSDLVRWADSLENLSLVFCGSPSLVGLAPLAKLQVLNLAGTPDVDLTQLPALPKLHTVQLWGGRATANLSPLRRLPALDVLRLFQVDEVDLTPLNGMDVQISAPKGTTVHGLDAFVAEGGTYLSS